MSQKNRNYKASFILDNRGKEDSVEKLIEGVKKEIAAVQGVDILFVGPFDLSHGLGLTGQLAHPDVRAAITKIFETGRKHGKWLGVLAPDPSFAEWSLGLGVRFLTYRSDVRFLKAAAAANAAEVAALRKRVT